MLKLIAMIKRFLSYLAARKMTEHMAPHKMGFFEKRIFADHIERYRFVSRFIKGKHVLDIACGEGYGTLMLARRAKKIVGVDISDDMMKHKHTRNVKFVCCDVLEFLKGAKEQFDVVVSFETVEHIKDYKRFISLIHRSLKKGRILVMSTPNKELADMFFGGTFNPYHVKEFYTQELHDAILDVFRSEPEILRQRPVRKNHKMLSAISAFLVKKSSIVKDAQNITAIGNIYIARKNRISAH